MIKSHLVTTMTTKIQIDSVGSSIVILKYGSTELFLKYVPEEFNTSISLTFFSCRSFFKISDLSTATLPF